jgi:hypothetical protein
LQKSDSIPQKTTTQQVTSSPAPTKVHITRAPPIATSPSGFSKFINDVFQVINWNTDDSSDLDRDHRKNTNTSVSDGKYHHLLGRWRTMHCYGFWTTFFNFEKNKCICTSGCRHLMGFWKYAVYHILFYKTKISDGLASTVILGSESRATHDNTTLGVVQLLTLKYRCFVAGYFTSLSVPKLCSVGW